MQAPIGSRAVEDLYRNPFESVCGNVSRDIDYEILLIFQASIIFVNCWEFMDSKPRRYAAMTMNSFLNHAFLVGILSPFDPPSEFFSIKQRDLLCKLAIHNRLTLYYKLH